MDVTRPRQTDTEGLKLPVIYESNLYFAGTAPNSREYDWNVMISHSARFINVLKEKGVPVQVYFHQGGHGGAQTFSMMNKWFTGYLFDVQNNVENDPKAWIVHETTTDPNPPRMPIIQILMPDPCCFSLAPAH